MNIMVNFRRKNALSINDMRRHISRLLPNNYYSSAYHDGLLECRDEAHLPR